MPSTRSKGFAIVGLVVLAAVVGAGGLVEPPDLASPSTGPSAAAPVSTPSRPIVVTKDDTTITGVTIVGSGTGSGISAIGTAKDPIENLTIRDCTIRGFETGIEVRHVKNLTIEGCTIDDSTYAGILVISGIGGRISDNVIRKVGYYTPLDTVNENNAYGIALTRIATTDFVTDPATSDFVVDSNTVEDVPYWHCLDTHAGQDITFSHNITRRCPRPIFITVDGIDSQPRRVTVSGNRLEQALQVSGGTDARAITLVNLQTGTIDGNTISQSYPQPFVLDYLGLDAAGSTDVTISGETSIP